MNPNAPICQTCAMVDDCNLVRSSDSTVCPLWRERRDPPVGAIVKPAEELEPLDNVFHCGEVLTMWKPIHLEGAEVVAPLRLNGGTYYARFQVGQMVTVLAEG